MPVKKYIRKQKFLSRKMQTEKSKREGTHQVPGGPEQGLLGPVGSVGTRQKHRLG